MSKRKTLHQPYTDWWPAKITREYRENYDKIFKQSGQTGRRTGTQQEGDQYKSCSQQS